MTPYLFVGGPQDGLRLETDGTRIVRIPSPAPQPLIADSWRGWVEPTLEYAEYERFGSIYWWEGLIGDAYCNMAVSDQVLAEGGPLLRTEVRRRVRRELEHLAKGKALGRIVWRVAPNAFGEHVVRAFVGPRAPERALAERAKRRGPTVTLTRPASNVSPP